MTAPTPDQDLTNEPIDETVAALTVRVVQGRDKVRARLVAALLAVVVVLLAAYTAAAWSISSPEAWQRVNTVLGGATTTFLTLLGGSIAWYFAGQGKSS